MNTLIETPEARRWILRQLRPFTRRIQRIALCFGIPAATLVALILSFLGERDLKLFIGCFSIPIFFALLPDLSAFQIRLTKRSWEFNEKEIRVNGSKRADIISWSSIAAASIEGIQELPSHVRVKISDGEKINFSIIVSNSDIGLRAFERFRNRFTMPNKTQHHKSDPAGGSEA